MSADQVPPHDSTEPGEVDASSAPLNSEIFSGTLGVKESLNRLRSRLLDLSARNRLLNFKHSKFKSLQFVGVQNLDGQFERLLDSKAVTLAPVPRPKAFPGVAKIEVLEQARVLGIPTLVDLPDATQDLSPGRRGHQLQTLLYPEDLERFARKAGSNARTVIEETGSNMLFLVFGFLEWYETDESERAMLAPLLALPVGINRGKVDPQTNVYQYTLAHTGEDVAENHTLREKLKQDYRLILPPLGEEESPESYFQVVAGVVRTKPRWRVRRQLTMAMLSFGKLAIWADLDPAQWPDLTSNRLLCAFFAGGSGQQSGSLEIAPDYSIDQHPKVDLPLIFDADSSQHSALIDALDGRDMVINGPPGTGKSQTITNLIAAALATGKKVLFVSEKLAALEVVRNRLDRAGLGHFCLELHSHKTQKKKFVEEIQARVTKTFPAAQHVEGKLAVLAGQRNRLHSHLELLGSKIGNRLDRTVGDILWLAERRRQQIGDQDKAVLQITIPGAHEIGFLDLEHHRSLLLDLAERYQQVGDYGPNHAWWGFTPAALAPGDEETLRSILTSAEGEAVQLQEAASSLQAFLGEEEPLGVEALLHAHVALSKIGEVPERCLESVLSALGKSTKPMQSVRTAQTALDRVKTLTHELQEARHRQRSGLHLSPADGVGAWRAAQAWVAPQATGGPILGSHLLGLDLKGLNQFAAELLTKLAALKVQVETLHPPAATLDARRKEGLERALAAHKDHPVLDLPLARLQGHLEVLSPLQASLRQALARLVDLTLRRSLPFDGTREGLARLQTRAGLPGLLTTEQVDNQVLTSAQSFATSPWADEPLEAAERNLDRLVECVAEAERILERASQVTGELGLPFSGSLESLEAVQALLGVATSAPQELLGHRQDTFAEERFDAVLERAKRDHEHEATERRALDETFYLDALPPSADLRRAQRIFRRGDGIFNFLNSEWRWAKSQLTGISRTKAKRNAVQAAEVCQRLADWMDHRTEFLASTHYRRYFGDLFTGLDTDFSALATLRAWYRQGQEGLLPFGHPFADLDFTTLSAKALRLVGSSAGGLLEAFASLDGLPGLMETNLPRGWGAQSRIARLGWPGFLAELRSCIEQGRDSVRWFRGWGEAVLTPKRILELLEAWAELRLHQTDFDILQTCADRIRAIVGQDLGDLFGDARPRPLIEHLDELDRWVQGFRDLADLLQPLVTPSTTPREAWRYLAARLSLAKVLQGAMLEARSREMDAYLGWVDQVQHHARSLVDLLEPFGRPDLPVATLLDSLEGLVQGDELEATLKADVDAVRLFGDYVGREDAPLESLACTLQWAERVANSELPYCIVRTLVGGQARVARARLGEYLSLVDAVFVGLQAQLARLKRLGTFQWEAWISHPTCTAPVLPGQLVDRFRCVLAAIEEVQPLSRYLVAAEACNTPILGSLAAGLRAGDLKPETLALSFERALYVSISKEVFRQHPELAGFAGKTHEKLRAEFQALDTEIIKLNGQRIAHQVDANKQIPMSYYGPKAADYTEALLINREIAKSRRHIPIRQLLLRAGRTLQALKPCFMMGPLSVAQYLSHGTLEFDIVIMDEASQLRPEDALGAVIRGKQLIVVGDPKQLPPTSFFDRMADEIEEEDEALANIEGSESILDICQGLFTPARTLRWHYRSQHQSLIDFSNFHFYQNSLVVFPSPYERNRNLGVSMRYVRNGAYKDRRNIPEALQVVEAVFEHMKTAPHESLGVVSLNLTQRDLIQELFEKKLKTCPEVENYLRTWEEAGSPFFVKNLENVQGDERDVIFISTTFGKAEGTTRLYQRFGPISRPEGWRRLNVLFTRSKRRTVLHTSMQAEDIVVDETTPIGTRALRDYLDFARRGVLAHVTLTDREPDSDFEVSVATVLREHGYEVVPQLGVANFFLDIAVRNPNRRGEFLAGIECDGATYHQSASARDRDRIRQEILEGLGWKGRIWRIWSTDWFTSPRREISRLLAFLEERKQVSLSEPYDDLWLETQIEELTGEAERDDAEISDPLDKVELDSTIDQDDEFYAEVGDTVTYEFLDAPEVRQEVRIIPGQTAGPDTVGEAVPLAVAILGNPVGEVCVMHLGKARGVRQLRILKISRN